MILGGGYYQLPLIKKSVELGYYTIVCGISGNYPGYKYASKWYDVDTFDKEACLNIAQNEHIDGILTCGTDAMMTTLGYVCDKMNLLGPTEESAHYATNKALMKERFIQAGVRTASFRKIQSLSDAEAFSEEYGYPLVLKVVDGCGGRGVSIINNKEDLHYYFPIIKSMTKVEYLVIEEYISGEEFGAQAFVSNGKIDFVMPHGDIVYHSATDIPIGHYAPYEKENLVLSDITKQLYLCIEALGIDNTAINADFILHDGKAYVLEIGARAGATCLPELVSLFYGYNYYEYLLRKCVDEDSFDIHFKGNMPTLVETIISEKSGILKAVNCLGPLPKEVITLDIFINKGEKVSSFRNAYDRIGSLIMQGEDINYLFELSKKIKDNLIILD